MKRPISTTPGLPLPSVSVIVPAYNAQDTLARAVASALGQTHVEAEVVVVNDGSTDATTSVAESMRARDARVRVIHQPNRGLSAARNAGLDAARGEFVQFLDADDTLEPAAAAALVASACDGGATGAAGAFALVDADGGEIATQDAPRGPLDHAALRGLPFVIVSSLLTRRDVFTQARFDPQCSRVEDYDLWFRLARAGVRWVPCPAMVTRYYIRPGTLSTDYESMLHAGRRIVEREFAWSRRQSHPDDEPALLARWHAVVTSLVHSWAARAAIVGGDGAAHARALAMLRAQQAATIDPDRAAGHALSAVRMGLATPFDPAEPGQRSSERLARIAGWWEALARAGYTDRDEQSFIREAHTHLARRALGSAHTPREPRAPLGADSAPTRRSPAPASEPITPACPA